MTRLLDLLGRATQPYPIQFPSAGLALLACLAAGLLLAWPTLNWPFEVIDTPKVIAQHLLSPQYQYFYDPHKYQLLTPNNLTPWITFSVGTDLDLFGLDAPVFRAHNILSYLALIAIVFYGLCTATRDLVITLIFSMAVAFYLPTLDVLEKISTRHYLEGMLFSLSSLLLFNTYLCRRQVRFLAGSLLTFCLAISAKETFAPLPAVMFFMGNRSFAGRIRDSIPFALVCLAYLGWRFHMLSTLGGYGNLGDPWLLPNLRNGLFRLLGESWLSIHALLVALILVVYDGATWRPGRLVPAFICLACLMLPFLFLGIAGVFDAPRWGFTPGVAILVYVAYLTASNSNALLKVLGFSVALATIGHSLHSGEAISPKNPGVASNLVVQLLEPSESRAMFINGEKMQGFAQGMIPRGVSSWRTVALLSGREEAVMPLFYAPQLHIHKYSLEDLGESAKNLSAEIRQREFSFADIGPTISTGAEGQDLIVTVLPGQNLERCYVYLYTRNNGVPFPVPDCESTALPLSFLNWQAHGLDRPGEDVFMRGWGQDTSGNYVISSEQHLGRTGETFESKQFGAFRPDTTLPAQAVFDN